MTLERQSRGGWRLKVGILLFVMSIGWPLVLPVLSVTGVSGTTIAAFSGIMMAAAELMLVAAAAIAGKEGYALIKTRVLGLLKSFGPPQTVSRSRYRIGLVLFITPLLIGWAAPYLGPCLPLVVEHPLAVAIGGDALLGVSLFVLGGDFWSKLRSLFLHRARAVIPDHHRSLAESRLARPT